MRLAYWKFAETANQVYNEVPTKLWYTEAKFELRDPMDVLITESITRTVQLAVGEDGRDSLQGNL